jgi:surface carbohydrate biosynthesis protein
MKNIIIIYEVFKREAINVSILKLFLESKSFKVYIFNKSEINFFIKCDYLIIPNSYNTSDLENYIFRFNCSNGKILSLNIEQIIEKARENNNKEFISESAKNIFHACWGQNTVNKLLKDGVQSSNIFLTGPVLLDSLRDEFNNLWLSKQDLSKIYGLNNNNKWILFISSFTYASENQSFINAAIKAWGHEYVTKLIKDNKKSQLDILTWIDGYLSSSNNIFIYRPHPTEYNSSLLSKLRSKYPNNFYIIGDLNIKQWIKACDLITMWNSTSIIECFYLNKKTFILQPNNPPEQLAYNMFDNCLKITNYNDFLQAMGDIKEYTFPIKKEILNYYYNVTNQSSTERIYQLFISNVYIKGEKYRGYFLKRIIYLIKKRIIMAYYLKKIYIFLFKYLKYKISNTEIRNRYFLSEWEDSVFHKKEFSNIFNKLK